MAFNALHLVSIFLVWGAAVSFWLAYRTEGIASGAAGIFGLLLVLFSGVWWVSLDTYAQMGGVIR